MPGSWTAGPVSVCDIAVPLWLHSNAVDRIAIAEGATKLDDDLMINLRPNPGRTFRPGADTVPHIRPIDFCEEHKLRSVRKTATQKRRSWRTAGQGVQIGSRWPELRDQERAGHIGAGTALHGLRMSCAAWWRRNGANTREVANRIGDKPESRIW
jgi:hypothetical protein